METKQLSPAQTEARRSNARKSTGPRTARGKHHSSRNAHKHGLYSDVEFFFCEAALELGEDPQQLRRLYEGLLEARRPADTLEQVLVEEITVLIWKQSRLERSESAVQVCNVRQHDLERRKQYIQVGRDVTTLSQNEALEKGLRVAPGAPGNFERVIAMLGMLEEMAERGEFNEETFRLLKALYGEQPTLRGAGLFNIYLKLDKLPPGSQEFQDAQKLFLVAVTDETLDVLEEYDLFLHEHVQNTRAARIAAMAPSHAQWAAIIRQQNSLHRQLERKIRLLDEIQERRRESKSSALDLMAKLSKLAPLHRDSHEPEDGGGKPGGGDAPQPTAPPPSSPEEGNSLDSPAASPNPSSPLEAAQMGTRGNPPVCPDGQPERPHAVLVEASVQGQPQALPLPGSACAPKTKNRGNEAKKSLKTNEVVPTKCAKRTQTCAPRTPNEAKNVGFACRSYQPTRPRMGWRRPRFSGSAISRREIGARIAQQGAIP